MLAVLLKVIGFGTMAVPLGGTLLGVRDRVWERTAGLGFLLWLAVNGLGNLATVYIGRILGRPTYVVGLVALPLQVMALTIALIGLTTDRRHHRRILVGAAGFGVLQLVAFAFPPGETHWTTDYLLRSPYTLLAAVGCGFAFLQRTTTATLPLRRDGARLALVGVLIAVLPTLIIDLTMWATMQGEQMDHARILSRITRITLVTSYLVVALGLRHPWTFARSG